jgi:hypothetical protein
MILDDPVLVLNSETDEEERKADKAIWASATANFRQLSIRNPNVRSKLWVSHKKTNGVLANDLIALIRQPDGSQHLGFRGDTTWKTAIEPIEGLTEGEEGYELIFDSLWGVGDERLGRLLNRILMIHKGV